jgi:hypothetical protein
MTPLLGILSWIVGGYLAPLLYIKYDPNPNADRIIRGKQLVQSLVGAAFGWISIFMCTLAWVIIWYNESEEGKKFQNKKFF